MTAPDWAAAYAVGADHDEPEYDGPPQTPRRRSIPGAQPATRRRVPSVTDGDTVPVDANLP